MCVCVYVSSYYNICVDILIYMCLHTTINYNDTPWGSLLAAALVDEVYEAKFFIIVKPLTATDGLHCSVGDPRRLATALPTVSIGSEATLYKFCKSDQYENTCVCVCV